MKAYFETFLSSGCGEYSFEIQKYVTDLEFALPEEKERLDFWWKKALKTNRYPVLSSLVRSCLSIFTGPMVECLFSMMNVIIDSRSGSMEIETYSFIVTTKYSLKIVSQQHWNSTEKIYCETLYIRHFRTICVHLHHVIKNAWKLNETKCCWRKKNLSSKKVFSEVAKKRRKETLHKQVIIYLWPNFRLKLKFIVLL